MPCFMVWSGMNILVNGQPASEYPGIEILKGESGRVEFRVTAGKYLITTDVEEVRK